jgi:acetyl-CoA acetyltransferase
VCYADNPRTGSRHAYEKAWGDDAAYGWFGVPAGYAMLARRHMEEFGTTSDQLGAIAVAIRKHGAANPNAQLRKALTLEQYRESPPVVDPLRRDDCCLVSDGAAAVVLTRAQRAKSLGVKKPVPILGFGQGHSSWDVAQRADLTRTGAEISGKTALNMAGLRPPDIDLAQIYDCFTITVLMTLEAYGFAPHGRGGPYCAEGRLEIGGELPLNTAGGLLSETGMPGLQLVTEGVRQMRGEATLQVKGAENCIISNQGGIMHTHSTLVLGQCG